MQDCPTGRFVVAAASLDLQHEFFFSPVRAPAACPVPACRGPASWESAARRPSEHATRGQRDRWWLFGGFSVHAYPPLLLSPPMEKPLLPPTPALLPPLSSELPPELELDLPWKSRRACTSVHTHTWRFGSQHIRNWFSHRTACDLNMCTTLPATVCHARMREACNCNGHTCDRKGVRQREGCEANE